MTTLLALLSITSAPAAAGTPTWTWPEGQPVLYHIESLVVRPRTGNPVAARRNLEAGAREVKVVLDTTCTPKAVGKTAVEVTCSFAYVNFTGSELLPGDQANIDEILKEWSADIATGRVVMTMGRDGKMRQFDLQGLSMKDQRESAIRDNQRSVLQRAFAPFEFPFPEDPDAWKRGWEQKGGNALLLLPGTLGTAGAASLKHTPKGDYDGLFLIRTAGHASLSPGGAVEANATALIIDTQVESTTWWDLAVGLPVYRDLTLSGYRTASSAESSSGAEFYQVTAIQKVDAFLPGGKAPIPITAVRSPKYKEPAPDLPAGVKLVPFAELGMASLFLPQMPESAQTAGLPTSVVKCRVLVNADGSVKEVWPFEGYVLLGEAVDPALRAARFPAKGEPYGVDLDVEVRRAAEP